MSIGVQSLEDCPGKPLPRGQEHELVPLIPRVFTTSSTKLDTGNRVLGTRPG